MKEEIEANGTSELSAVVGALLDTLDDKNEIVREAVVESVRKISRQQPYIVIHAAVYYREMHRKMSTSHVAAVLRVMMETCRDEPVYLGYDLATSVAELAVKELSNGENEKEASELLVSLSRSHCTEVMGGILCRNSSEPNVVPNCAVIRAMGMIASCNPFGMVPFIKLALSVILPMLGQIHDESHKRAFCFALGKFAEAINDYVMNLDEAPDPGITKDAFAEEMSDIFDILTSNWLKTSRNEIKLAESILTAISPILPLLPIEKKTNEKMGNRASRLTPILLNLCKWPNARLASTRVLSMLLNCTNEDDKEYLRPFLEQMHQTLFELVSVTPFEAYRDALLTHYEVLQCSRAIVVLYPEEGLDRILQQLKSPTGNNRSRALVVLKHLINTLPTEDDATLQRIALSLQNALSDGSARQMVGAIVALTAHPTLPLLMSQRATFIRFMVLRCCLADDEPQAYEEALYLLATTVEGAESWLWPSLIRAFLDIRYTQSVIPVSRALSALAVKIIRGDGSLSNLQKEFPGTKILARCLDLLADEKNRLRVIAFLRSSAPLMGHSLKPIWDAKLLEITTTLEAEDAMITSAERIIAWEERMVEFLDESLELEGETWGQKLGEELMCYLPDVAPYLATVTKNPMMFSLLVSFTSTDHPSNEIFSRSLGFAAKRNIDEILRLMEKACSIEDEKKNPTKFLGLVRDSKAAASSEAIKANLLRAYGEIAKRGDAGKLFFAIERHILPWIIGQLNDSKDLSSKEAGLVALEQVAGAVHPNRLANSTGLKARSGSLATLLALLQSTTGHRPLIIYPAIMRAILALLRIPPLLSAAEREILLSTVLDKVIGASNEIDTLLSLENANNIVESLSIVCSEIVLDSADAIAELVDILLPWMQSKSAAERRATLLVLRSTLKSYHDSLKYTYPDGKLKPGKLLGRILSWSADTEISLRSLVVDCVALSLGIGARHRSTLPDNNLTQDLSESKKILNTIDTNVLYEGVRSLAIAGCERIATGEVVNLAEGLIEGLLFRAEGGLAAGIGLTQLFRIRGLDIPRADLYLVDNIISQMRQMENTSCRRGAASAIKSLSIHHPEEVMEHLLHQPLPLDRGTEECWNELGTDDAFGLQALDYLLTRLENENALSENSSINGDFGKYNTAAFPSLAAMISLRHLLQSTNSEILIEKRLAELVSILLKYLSGWLHVVAPISIISTKYGFVPNRETSKLNPHREVYSVLTNILTVVNSSVASSLLNESVFDSETQADESLVSTVRSVVRCLSKRSDILANLAHSIGKLVTSVIPAQRAVAASFYAELIGRVDCGVIWLDAIINALHEAKSDSSPLVRKLATIGLTRIAFLDAKQIDEYFENCMEALLEGLEEPPNCEGGAEVVLESLRGLSILLSIKTERPTSPRVVLALKPFVEKENWEMRLSAISALGAVSSGWMKIFSIPDDDVTDHLLGCLPCLTMKIEDPNDLVSKAARETLCEASNLLQCDELSRIIKSHLAQGNVTNVENFLGEFIECLKKKLPQRAEELRNAVARGYSRSENSSTRATSVLILGLFGQPRPEDVQRMLQLLRDKESIVKVRAAKALALGFTHH